jgi:hypothetical protein
LKDEVVWRAAEILHAGVSPGLKAAVSEKSVGVERPAGRMCPWLRKDLEKKPAVLCGKRATQVNATTVKAVTNPVVL